MALGCTMFYWCVKWFTHGLRDFNSAVPASPADANAHYVTTSCWHQVLCKVKSRRIFDVCKRIASSDFACICKEKYGSIHESTPAICSLLVWKCNTYPRVRAVFSRLQCANHPFWPLLSKYWDIEILRNIECSYISGPRSVLFVFVKREQRMKPTRIRGRWCSIAGVFWISCYFGFDLILGLVCLFVLFFMNEPNNERNKVCLFHWDFFRIYHSIAHIPKGV